MSTGLREVSGNVALLRTCPSRSCHAKCINTRYAEGDLNKGESVCIDRCVAKFFEVNKKVGEKLQAMGANAAGASQSAFGSL